MLASGRKYHNFRAANLLTHVAYGSIASILPYPLSCPLSQIPDVFAGSASVGGCDAAARGMSSLSPLPGLPAARSAARFTELGGTILTGSPADFGKLIVDEIKERAGVVSTANIKPE